MSFLNDLQYGWRILARRPGFTIVAVLSLALGIGVNTTVFSLIDAVLLLRFPYAQADRLVVIESIDQAGTSGGVAPANFADWKKQSTAFEFMAAKIDWTGYRLAGPEGPEQVIGAPVSSGMFEVLGVQPQLGRTFLPQDDQPEAEGVVALSDGLWARRYGRSADLLGRTISIDGRFRTVVAIMPAGFYLNRDENTAAGHVDEMWVPVQSEFGKELMTRRTGSNFRIFARLKPGVSMLQAQSEMTVINNNLQKAYPNDNARTGVSVRPLVEFRAERIRGPRETLLILFGAVTLVLLIACTNVANLQLSLNAGREREMAIRTALGASRLRIILQMLTESVLLGLAGGGLGIGVCIWSMSVITALVPDNLQLPRLNELSMDHRVLAYTIGISLVSGVLTGIFPALKASGHRSFGALSATLKASGRTFAGGAGQRLRWFMIVSETALALVLLIGGGLLIRSLLSLQTVDPGFNSDNLLTVRIPAPDRPPNLSQVDAKERDRFVNDVLRDVENLPGIVSVAMVDSLPLTSSLHNGDFIVRDAPGARVTALSRVVSPQYFQTMGIPLRSGRSFESTDTDLAPRVAVINKTLADRYFLNQNPIGKQIRWETASASSPFSTIIGVVGDIRDNEIFEEPSPEIYSSSLQAGSYFLNTALVVRTAVQSTGTAGSIRQHIQQLNPGQPVPEILAMRTILSRSIGPERFVAWMLAILASISLVLAAAGIYGVVSNTVGRRTREIGIRIALGAGRSEVLRMILQRELPPVLVGIAIGCVGAAGATRAIAGQLHGITTTDLPTFACVTVILTIVALTAIYIPSRRAMKVEPTIALRED